MTRNQRLAQSFKALQPGLNIILLGLVIYVLIRKVAPHNSDIAALVYFVSHLAGLITMWSGYSKLIASNKAEDEDEKQAFIQDMRKASSMAPAEESESFSLAVTAAMALDPALPVGSCWAYDITRQRNRGEPYRVRVFIAFGRELIGLAIVYGLEGVWHKSSCMAARYDQSGAVLTLSGVAGDLKALAGNGTRIIAFQRSEGPPTIKMASSKVGDLFETSLPPCLQQYMAEENLA